MRTVRRTFPIELARILELAFSGTKTVLRVGIALVVHYDTAAEAAETSALPPQKLIQFVDLLGRFREVSLEAHMAYQHDVLCLFVVNEHAVDERSGAETLQLVVIRDLEALHR